MFQQIQVPASSVPAGAEFGIYVSGDSMEPRYHSGQIVWVERCEELECGDIGIFVYDDCGYLKKYDEHTPDTVSYTHLDVYKRQDSDPSCRHPRACTSSLRA